MSLVTKVIAVLKKVTRLHVFMNPEEVKISINRSRNIGSILERKSKKSFALKVFFLPTVAIMSL